MDIQGEQNQNLMLDINIIDRMVEFVVSRIGPDAVFQLYGGETNAKQYLAYHFMHGNLVWTENSSEEITGVMITYECDEEEAHKEFDWNPTQGKNCIFVAELVAADERARNLLAKAFLQRYPEKKETFGFRHGRVVKVRAHDISNNFTNN